ncbi:MAG: hypothetical protein B7C24_13845 [Bacteroidetes bacterium 4572_77]|nr:MAG: hypothetical protein B7C24_13845 [Bacteroidetes bacterium 4572_77]
MKIFVKIVWVLLSVILFQNTANSQQISNLSLEDAVSIALKQNFDIQISKKSLEAAQINNTWGAAGMFPSINLGVGQNNRWDNQPSQVTDDRQNSFSSGARPYVQMQWMLFNGFSVYIAKDKLALLEEYSEGNMAVVVENKIQAVILSYHQNQRNIEKLNSIDKVKKLSRDRYFYEQTKKQFGSSGSYDVLQSKDAYLSDSTNFLMQSLELKKSQLNLNLLMGVDKDAVFDLTSAFEATVEDYQYFDLEEKMNTNNTTLQNQYINQEILKKDIGLAKAIVWPNLSLNTGADYNNNYMKYENLDANNSYSYDFYVNFSLNFNLFNGGKTHRAIQQAHIQQEIGDVQIEQIKQILSNGLLTVYEMYEVRKQLLSVANARLETAQLNLDLSTEKFRNGTINSFNFRDVQIQYINAEFSQLEAVYNLIDSHTELLRITGGIISEFE